MGTTVTLGSKKVESAGNQLRISETSFCCKKHLQEASAREAQENFHHHSLINKRMISRPLALHLYSHHGILKRLAAGKRSSKAPFHTSEKEATAMLDLLWDFQLQGKPIANLTLIFMHFRNSVASSPQALYGLSLTCSLCCRKTPEACLSNRRFPGTPGVPEEVQITDPSSVFSPYRLIISIKGTYMSHFENKRHLLLLWVRFICILTENGLFWKRPQALYILHTHYWKPLPENVGWADSALTKLLPLSSRYSGWSIRAMKT